jgi:hypothetical protein
MIADMKKLFLCGLSLLLIFSVNSNLKAQAFKSDTIDILHYSIHLDLVHLSKNELKAYTEITFHPKMLTNSFSLDLLRLNIDSISLNNQAYTQYSYNDTVIQFTTWPMNISDTFNLRIYYHGTPVIEPYNWGGFHFLNDSSLAYNLGVAFQDYPHNYGRVWYPCLDDFKDRATYDFYIDTKPGMQAVCGGTLVDTTHFGNKIRWHWKLEQSIPSYLSSVAVSDFSLIKGEYIGINDTIPTYVYVRQQDSAKAATAFSHLNDMMSIYESRFGPYRWPRVGYVGTTKGAMEHATNIAYPRTLIMNNHSYDWLIAHELSHHWFGDLVTCETAEDMWINEGWAVFSEAIFMEGMYGKGSYTDYIMNIQRDVIQYAHTASQDGAYYPLYPMPQTITYGTTVYDKGCLVAHTLRGYLGDSLFFNTVQKMLVDKAFTEISSYEMRDYFTTESGVDMTGFFDNWVFTEGFPHYSVDSFKVLSSTGLYNVEVFARQKRRGRTSFGNNNRIELAFLDASGNTHYDNMIFNGEYGNHTFQLSFIPELIWVDPNEMMADAITSKIDTITQGSTTNFDDQMFKLIGNQSSGASIFRVEHHWVEPDPMINNPTGLTISPSRYWTISGIFDPSFDASGQFYFSRAAALDGDLIIDLNDSIVILYREKVGDEWVGIPFTKTPSNNAGYITVPDLKAGQYTIAIWDEQYINIDNMGKPGRKVMKVFPNPGSDKVYLELDNTDSAEVKIYDIQGTLVLHKDVIFSNNIAELSTTSMAPGTYQIQLINKENQQTYSNTLIISND